jgi:gluconate kinase
VADAPPASPRIELHFLYLEVELREAEALVDERHRREKHYLEASMVRSQYAILELPGVDEGGTVSVVKNDGTVGDVQRSSLQEVKRVMGIN